jgi:hypothetical protein
MLLLIGDTYVDTYISLIKIPALHYVYSTILYVRCIHVPPQSCIYTIRTIIKKEHKLLAGRDENIKYTYLDLVPLSSHLQHLGPVVTQNAFPYNKQT